MVDVGLKLNLITISSPFEIPPWIPPLLFVEVDISLFSEVKASLCCEPVISVPLKPEPNSIPLNSTGMLINAFDKSALIYQTPVRQVLLQRLLRLSTIAPPTESPAFLMLAILCSILVEISGLGHLTILASTIWFLS